MSDFRKKIYTVIFETDTKLGKAFDIVLIWAILFSVLAVILESVQEFRDSHGDLLRFSEWFFTILFSVEYIIRIYTVSKPKKYIFSFFGLVDLLSILPTFLSIFFAGAQSLMIIRAFRLLRIFRVLKLGRFMGQANSLMKALSQSRERIIVFVGVVLIIAVIMGSVMYLVEGEDSGFTSIPRGIYWAIVTMTTVGYGDITPKSEFGQFLSALLMTLGYGIIAIPTGIVTAEIMTSTKSGDPLHKSCSSCSHIVKSQVANFCEKCGKKLQEA